MSDWADQKYLRGEAAETGEELVAEGTFLGEHGVARRRELLSAEIARLQSKA